MVVAIGSKMLYITSIPYAVNKAQLVEQIGDVVLSRKMPHLVDVRDVSTDDVRIELELKAGADDNLVMAYLFKNTSLQTTFAVNLTCLVPTENPEVGRPERLDLKQMLWHFLHFRLEVVTSRLEHELEQLERRIHLLEGFEKVFDALDEIIKIIRKSDGKADSAEKIMKRFALDAEQTDAILELKLYRLARLEILVIQNELAREAQARAADCARCSRTKTGRWKLVRERARGDPEQVRQPQASIRAARSIEEAEEVEYSADAFIVEEDNVVHRVARRLGEAAEGSEGPVDDAPARRRQRAGGGGRQHPRHHGVLHATSAWPTPAASSTCRRRPATASRCRSCSSSRTASSVIAAFSLDPRVSGDIGRIVEDAKATKASRSRRRCTPWRSPATATPALLAAGVRRAQHAIGPPLRARARRRRSGERGDDDRRRDGDCRDQGSARDAVLGRGSQLPLRPRPRRHPHQARRPDDKVIGAIVSRGDRDLLTVETSRGAEQTISTGKYEVTGRGGKGRELMQRAQFVRMLPQDVALPVLPGNE